MKPGPKPKPISHGTYGGYQAERKRGEPHCTPCREANSAYTKACRQKPGAAEREGARNSARSRAVWRLANEYPDRFQELYLEEVTR